MGHPRYSAEEIARRGQAIYDERIAPLVEEDHFGEHVVIDIETGAYEVDRDSIAATDRAHARHPGGAFHGVKVGFPTALRLGGRWLAAME